MLKGKIREEWKIKLQITQDNDTSTFKFRENIIEGKIKYRTLQNRRLKSYCTKLNDSFIELLSDWSSKLRERKIFEIL